jgi:hypothetical protein
LWGFTGTPYGVAPSTRFFPFVRFLPLESRLKSVTFSTMSSCYFFKITTPSGAIRDPEGTNLSSLEEARAEALADARTLMSAAILEGRDISGRSVEICNGADEILLTVPFRDAISSIE